MRQTWHGDWSTPIAAAMQKNLMRIFIMDAEDNKE